MRKITFSILAGIAALSLAAPAAAQTVTYNGTNYTAGQSFMVNFDGSSSGVPTPGLSSSLNLTFTGLSGNDYAFFYALTDTSNDILNPQARITALGFDVNPNISGGSVTGAYSNTSNGSISNGSSVEFCITDGPNCAGGGGGGIAEFGNGTFALDFGAGSPGQITFSNLLVRYQSTGLDGEGSGIGRPVGAVPEPGTWAMMLLGFGGIGYSMRRRRKSTAIAQLA